MIAKLSVVLFLACVAHSKPITVSTAPALSVAHTSLAVEHPALAVAHAPLALHAPTYAVAHSPTYAVAHSPTYAVAHSPTYAVAHAPTYAVQQQIAVAHAPALTLTHAPIAVAHAPVAVAHAPVAQTVDYHAEPKYSFSYGVQDAHTGDAKEQKETRVGDVVHGSYSLIEPDGSKRIVEYTADDHNGFNAVVHREPNAHPAVVSHAPIAVQHASIAVAHAPLALLHH